MMMMMMICDVQSQLLKKFFNLKRFIYTINIAIFKFLFSNAQKQHKNKLIEFNKIYTWKE